MKSFANKNLLAMSLWLVVVVLVSVVAVRETTAHYEVLKACVDDAGGKVLRAVPFSDTDPHAWVMQSEQAEADGVLALRQAQWHDGKPISWTSPYAWVLRILARTWMALGLAENLREAAQWSAIWANALIAVVAVMALAAAMIHIFGPWAGAAGTASLMLAPEVVRRFSAPFVDHHGLVAVIIAWWLLSLCAMSSKAQSNGDWHAVAWASAAAAAGLWVSVLNIIAILALGALAHIAGRISLRRSGEKAPEPRLWYLWGVLCAGWLLLACLVEYGFSGWPVRFDLLSGLHCACVLGAGAIMVLLCQLADGQTPTRWSFYLAAAGIAPAATCALLMAKAGTDFFYMADPAWGRISSQIGETLAGSPSLLASGGMLWIAAGVLAWRAIGGLRRPTGQEATAAVFLAGSLLMMMRHARFGDVMAISLAILVAASLSSVLRVKQFLPEARIASACIAIHLVISIATIENGISLVRSIGGPAIAGTSHGCRAVAKALKQSTPGEQPARIFAPMDVGVIISYYSGATVLASVYWECLNAINDALVVFGGYEFDGVPEVLDRTRATHVIAVSGEWPFPAVALAGPKGRLLEPDSNGGRLARGSNVPPYLKPVENPDGKGNEFTGYRLYRVDTEELQKAMQQTGPTSEPPSLNTNQETTS